MSDSLNDAIEHFDDKRVTALLAAGADPNESYPEWNGARPLHMAVDIECEEACRREDRGDADARPRAILSRILIEAGADPDLPDAWGGTPRDWARERGHREALALFGDAPGGS